MPKTRILVVEDETIVARDIQLQLRSLGYDPVATTRFGEQAVELARGHRADLVLMDIQLAGAVDGITAAVDLRRDLGLPVVFLTAFAGDETLERAKLAEPFGYIIKPFEDRELRTVIQMALYKHESDTRLRQSYAEKAAIIHGALDGFLLVDLSGRILDANDAYCRMSQYNREELLKMSLVDITAGVTSEQLLANIEHIRQTGSHRFERQHRRRDGALIEVEVSVNFVTTSGGRLFSFVRDITERRRAERALAESEKKFAKFFQLAPAMMAVSTFEEGTFIDVNDRFLEVSGYTRDEVIGRRSVDLGWVSKESRERTLALMKEGNVRDLELVMRRKNGETFAGLYSGEAVDLDGRRLLISTWADLTERRRVETLLRLQSSALEAAANAIVITNREGRIEWANAAFERSSGFSASDANGKTPGQLLHSGKHPREFFEQMWKTILAGRVWSGEIINRRKDGSLIHEEMTITPVKDESGQVNHFVAVKQDVTQRKTLEEKFRQAQKMEAIGQLAGGVAHDFNNIMAGVLMYLSLLQDDSTLDPATKTSLNELSREVQRGASLTRQLLAFSRQQAMAPVQLNLNDAVTGLLKMLRRLLGEHISIEFKPAPLLPRVEADLGMIEQVVINLAVNARDAMPKGGPLTIGTSEMRFTEESVPLHPESRPGTFVHLSLSDAGVGMDAETLGRIFEPFFTTKPAGKGTGLGLATVYGIVKQHHGWVEVNSEPGRGSTFHIFLPVSDAPAGGSTPTETQAGPKPGSETILLVEDDPSVRVVAALSLRRLGYRVLEADTGPAAVRVWEQAGRTADLLLTDMVMPGGMNGRELAEVLRQTLPGLPVVLCTGYSQSVAEHPISPGERISLLQKPFDLTRLTDVVRRALDKPSAR